MNPNETVQHPWPSNSTGNEVGVELGHVPRKKKVDIQTTKTDPTEEVESHKLMDKKNLAISSNERLPIDANSTTGMSYTARTAGPQSGFATPCIRLVSEAPYILKISTVGVNTPSHRPSLKRSRSTSTTVSKYAEIDDSDSDDYKMTEEEEHKLILKRLKKKRSSAMSPVSNTNDNSSTKGKSASSQAAKRMGEKEVIYDHTKMVSSPLPSTMDVIEAPPPGVLSSLWYSRECFSHVWVMEKICGWKTRPKIPVVNPPTTLDGSISGFNSSLALSNDRIDLDWNIAAKVQQVALQSVEFLTDTTRRMEISRINPTQCPIVTSIIDIAESNHVNLNPGVEDREEVLLVKWRGRSYYHCSWERASDIERFDSSANSTSKNKIKRFYQQQEIKYGLYWREFLEEDRKAAANVHHNGSSVIPQKQGNINDIVQVDEYFSPQNLMIERILACDENELDMDVLAKQRAINMRDEQMEQRHREEQEQQTQIDGMNSILSKVAIHSGNDWDIPNDPEDNVRYVVKWKGLPYADITWEYWIDIKHDAVDEVEDFWYRQVAPDLEYAKQISNRPHPQMRDFKKLHESPIFGMSKKRRPIAKLESENGDVVHDITSSASEIDLGFRLRSYQLEGLNWLLFNWWNRRSCILADEMGLGKTIQSAAFLQELQSQPATQVRGPFLIVAPLSLIDQWQSELNSWAPDINVILYHGSADARDFLVQQEFYYTDQFLPKADALKLKKLQVTKFHVLITTYEVVLKDIAVLSKIRWRTLIVDEAHRLKNHKARLFDELASVPRDHCILLTGTPIANATEELWSLLHFANPSNFSDRDEFLEKFGQMTDSKQVNELHVLLKPYLLRRVKEDVEKSLPNKEETILEVSLTPIQKTFYKAIYERNTSYLFKGAKSSNAPSLMNVMMELRKCCNHPFLVKGAEDRILTDAAVKARGVDNESAHIDFTKLYAEQLVRSSGKMVLMEKLLQKLYDGGHKVLVFSQMVRVLDLLEDLLRIKMYRFERLDGSTSSSSRLHAVERFKKKECNRFVMLLSTRAGGLGLNLTVADIVIIFDSDWNPQNDMQAMARAHRIGQTRAVKVYRFLTAKTYEMHMFHSASLKLGLERAVMSQNREQGEDNDEGTKNLKKSNREAQAKEIDQLLKKGAYDVFRDDDDKEAEKFMETDIDQLLEHSSKTVSYGDAATSSLNTGLGSFSKASFVTSTEDGAKDVDLDDPDFWSKAVGLDAPPEELPEDIAVMIDDGVKRSRKQVEQYDPYADTAMAEQIKKDRVALEKILEKEEKDRTQEEKKTKLKKNKDNLQDSSIQRHRDSEKASTTPTSKEPELSHQPPKAVTKVPKLSTEMRQKKGKAKDRARARRQAEYESPLIEQLKQAWEIPQRNRATAAAIRFGFGRFCKLRCESNLSNLPLQDIEVFLRAYCYQIALQVTSTLLARLREGFGHTDIRLLVQEWLGVTCDQEVGWICDSIQSTILFQSDVEQSRSFLRIPLVLTEPTFVEDLRHGAAFRALRRMSVLSRNNRVISDSIDSIFDAIGSLELGKRGCNVDDLVKLDLDLKARFITYEELMIAIGAKFRNLNIKAPASWWDRSCDVALIVGTFLHGLSCYESMRRDRALPFAEKISRQCDIDLSCKIAIHRFRSAAEATRRAYDDALEAGRIKAELEVQAAVAAAAKAALQREEDAVLLRKGGIEAEGAVRNMPETQVNDAFEFDGTDTHFVTLHRMHQYIQIASRNFNTTTSAIDEGLTQDDGTQDASKIEDEVESRGGKGYGGRFKEYHSLPMPDARVLDYRLLKLLEEIENSTEMIHRTTGLWRTTNDVTAFLTARNFILPIFDNAANDIMNEYTGVGLGGNQCGISHRSLNDGCDFSFGSASNQIAQLAYGTDAPRYLRALGVPMNVTRFAICGLLYADVACLKELITSERLRYFGKEDVHLSEDIAPKSAFNDTIDLEGSSNSSTTGIFQDNSWIHSSSRPKLISPINPIELIHDVFRNNAKLRAFICYGVGCFGYPTGSWCKIDVELLTYLGNECGGVNLFESSECFDIHKFRLAVKSLDPELDVPDVETLQTYIETVLLPHCLRLCVNGNGPSTRNARGSHGDYETAFGISIHPEPSQNHPSPIPDPCLRLQEHSLEAVGFANAILRRVRLLRTCMYLCSNQAEIRCHFIVSKTKSKIMGQLNDMPLWWCPWIHDIAYLLHAATNGLFSLIIDRPKHPIFSIDAVQTFISTRVIPESKRHLMEQASMWCQEQACNFPTKNQLECRLGLLCGEVTNEIQGEYRFDYIPMFDHGGWPRK